jgi:hypothetical protein
LTERATALTCQARRMSAAMAKSTHQSHRDNTYDDNPAEIPQTREKQRQTVEMRVKQKCPDLQRLAFEVALMELSVVCQGEGRQFESGRPLRENLLIRGRIRPLTRVRLPPLIRQPDRRMSQVRLYLLRVRALRDKQRRTGVVGLIILGVLLTTPPPSGRIWRSKTSAHPPVWGRSNAPVPQVSRGVPPQPTRRPATRVTSANGTREEGAA